MSFEIEGVKVGGDNPCRFIVEISNSHNGDVKRALRMIDAAKAVGADFVKFQAFLPGELVTLRGNGPAPEPWGSQGWTMKTLYEKAMTPLDWFPRLFRHARDIGIVPFSSVFGLGSLAALVRVRCPAFKIAALDNTHEWLLRLVAATKQPVIVSDHIPYGRSMRLYGDTADCITATLWCPSGYPPKLEDVHYPARFSDSPDDHVGVSSHSLDLDLSLTAVRLGAKLIEQHMQLAAEPSELEPQVSLTEAQFADLIARTRAIEATMVTA